MKRFGWKLALPLIIIAFIGGAVLGVFGHEYYLEKTGARFDATVVYNRLQKIQDLTTVKQTSGGVVEFEKGKIPLISKDSFRMEYKAEIRAGYNMKKAKVEDADANGVKKVVVTLPEPEIQVVKVDPGSLKFYDQHNSIMGIKKTSENTAEAQKKAEQKVRDEIDKDELFSTCNESAKEAIEKLYAPLTDTGKYQLEVRTTK